MLRLNVDAREPISQRVEIEPFGRRVVRFDMSFTKAGSHRVMVTSSAGDALAIDDAGYAVVDAVDRAVVAIVGDDNPGKPTGGSFYLQRALAPRGDATDPLRIRHLRSDELTATALRDAEAVLIGDVNVLERPALDALLDHMQNGGGVLFFCGPGPVAQNLVDLTRASRGELTLPWQPIQWNTLDDPATFGEGAWTSPPLSVFDETSQFALQRIPITRRYTLGSISEETFHRLRFGDGVPALSSINYGGGKLTLANFTPSPIGGDLARRGVFVALKAISVASPSARRLLEPDAHRGLAPVAPAPTAQPMPSRAVARPLVAWTWVGGTVVLMYLVGFLAGTGLAVLAYLRFVSHDSWPVAAAVSGGTFAFVWLVFVRAMHIELDLGLVSRLLQP